MRIAVIGAGISGLAAAWLLARKHEVTLYEENNYFGGHTHTVDVDIEGIKHPVDTGFMVFNDAACPNLRALFQELGVETVHSDASFSVSLAEPRIEWAGTNLFSLFTQKRNLFNPCFWRMLKDGMRFNRELKTLDMATLPLGKTLGDFLEAGNYSPEFCDWYLTPMAAAIWSSPPAQILNFPLEAFICFFRDYNLLQIIKHPSWRTVKRGGREYVRELIAGIQYPVRRCTVTAVRRIPDKGVVVTTEIGIDSFDEAVLACHSDQALKLLQNPTPTEVEILSSIRYQPNTAILHTDTNLLPRRKRAWAGWNYLETGANSSSVRSASVSYLINKLQPLPFRKPVIVSLNPSHPPAADQVIAHFDYAHPVFDARAFEAQQRLGEINGRDKLWFCGAWTGLGLHEDGLKSALTVANGLGVRANWQ